MLMQRREDRRERGQVVVLFALMVPVILAVGSIVMSVGNWYVLKRHLQTQVDSAALAGGQSFTGCFQDKAATNLKVAQDGLLYSGDTSRSGTYNLQPQDTADVRVVLNSNRYWDDGDPTDGTGLDNTLNSPNPSTPCDTAKFDVKATDAHAPNLWRFIPLFPSVKSRALVEVHKVESTNGLRPLGVPEVDPVSVAVLIVNEDGTLSDPAAIRGKSLLDHQATPPAGLDGMSVWSKTNISPVGINGSDRFGVIVVATRDPSGLSLSGNLTTICNQNPTQTHCYSGATLTSGISYIHAYSSSGGGSATDPLMRDVSLGGGCVDDLSGPYFNLTGGCPIGITATIDFNTGANDPQLPVAQGGVCAEVTASPGGQMNWSGGVWTAAFTPLDVASGGGGPTQVNITTTTDTNGTCAGGNNASDTFVRVAEPYVSDDASGPVQYIKIEKSSGGLANSMEKDSAASFNVTVGLQPPLTDAALTDAPIPLRFWDTPSQSQALDCDNGANGWNNAMQNGCPDAYQIYDQAKHVSKCGPPPNGVPAADPEDCIESKNGNFQQNDVTSMLSPCGAHPNNWNRNGYEIPPPDDKRWMTLFILDELAFSQSGKRTYPIRRFGMFYVTAVSGLNCTGDVPNPAPSGKRTMFGHFISYVTPGFGETIPSDSICDFDEGGLCVVNLVE
jgi:hypothetical protein